MAKKQKLELTWIGKGDEPKLEPRVLIEDPEKSYGDPDSQNMLIHGDNLLALKALERDFSGKIKCIYIDPPYNTGNAFEHYDDGLEHSIWLDLMYKRAKLLYKLLDEDGLLAVQIDDNEFARLYLMLSEVFGGSSNLKPIVVKMSEASGLKMGAVKRAGIIPKYKEYIILAKKNGVKNLKPKYVPKTSWDYEYNIYLDNFDEADREFINKIESKEEIDKKDLEDIDQLLSKVKLMSVSQKSKELNIKENEEYDWLIDNAWRIARTAASTSVFKLAKDKKQYCSQQLFSVKSFRDGLLYIVKSDFKDDSKQPRVQLLFADNALLTHPGDLWTDIKTTGLEAEGGISFKNGKKPEALVERIIEMSTVPGDIVMDSFLGSGTTAAVAHKMRRKWIGVELGNHVYTHCIPRLKSIIDGKDNSGITQAVGWNEGGGYKYFELAPSLLSQDSYGNWVISKDYDANMLAHAMAKQEGFTYNPSQTTYWQQGFSTEKDYIYTTTQYVTVELLDSIHSAMQSDESLLIACKAFDEACKDRYDNITIKKIPQILLGRCEFGKEDYSLNISEETNNEANEADGEEE